MEQKSEKVRIAMLATELAVGGAERCLVNLATRLNQNRFDVAVYSLAPRPESDRDQLVLQLQEADVPVHFIGVRSNIQFFTAVRRLRSLLQEQRPDVLQTFLFHANILGAVAGRRADVPKIVMGIRVADPMRWRWYAERIFTRNAKKIVCVSESVADFCRTKVRFPSDKLIVIPNGVDPADYPAAQPADLAALGIPDGSQVAVVVGRLHRQKGIDWLLELWPRVVEKCNDCHLLIVGDGPQRSELEGIVATLGMARHVHVVGWRPDVPAILSSCQLLILPSRWEGMPNVLLEAMASGLPVVCTRAEGVQDVLGQLSVAQTVRFGDGDALVNSVNRVFEQPGWARALGEENRISVLGRFSVEQVAAAYQQLYESLV